MKNKTPFLLLLGCIIFATSCREIKIVDPDTNKDEKGLGIFINQSFLRPTGIDTLFINEGDTVKLTVNTILLNTPEYSWESVNEAVLKFIPDQNTENSVSAVAVADSGNITEVTLSDVGNDASKTIVVKIMKYWADSLFFSFMGSIDSHYYYMSTQKKTWSEAKIECEQIGGHLLSISSKEENELVHLSPFRDPDGAWIGMSFIDNPNLNRWVNGESVSYENYRSKPGDPGIFAEYYFYMDYEGKWENWHEIAYQFVLEMD